MSHLPNRPAFREALLAQDLEAARAAAQLAKEAAEHARGKQGRRQAARAATRASLALGAAESALVAERRAEPMAPAVQRQDIVQDGTILREARVVVPKGKRAQLVSPIERLAKRSKLVTARHVEAAERYVDAWQIAGMEAYPIGLGNPDAPKGVPRSGNWRIENAVGAGFGLADARRAVGMFGSALLDHLLVDELDVGAWAAKRRCDKDVAMGMLVMVLDRLAEHYFGPLQPGADTGNEEA